MWISQQRVRTWSGTRSRGGKRLLLVGKREEEKDVKPTNFHWNFRKKSSTPARTRRWQEVSTEAGLIFPVLPKRLRVSGNVEKQSVVHKTRERGGQSLPEDASLSGAKTLGRNTGLTLHCIRWTRSTSFIDLSPLFQSLRFIIGRKFQF